MTPGAFFWFILFILLCILGGNFATYHLIQYASPTRMEAAGMYLREGKERVDRNEELLQDIARRIDAHHDSPGHPIALERMRSLEARIQRLESSQREFEE